jgi:tripeptide aminopeptidase
MLPLAAKLFVQLTKIPSPSGKEVLLRNFLLIYFRKYSITCRTDRVGNLIAKLPGRGRPLILNSHLDTVNPCVGIKTQIKNGIIRSKGDTILGADDKAGVASILALITKLIEEKLQHRPLELIFSVQEEVGCLGTKRLEYKLIRGRQAVVIDRSASVNSITLSASFINRVEIICRGRAAHIVRSNEGINAITILASFINQINKKITKGSISSIGLINGGSVFNVVPEKAMAVGEIRALKRMNLKKELKRWQSLANQIAKKQGGKIILKSELLIQGYSIKKDNAFVKTVSKSIMRAGFSTVYSAALGASDANVFNQHGIVAIPIGQGRTGAHSLKEAIPIQAFIDTEKILINLVTNIQ